MSKVESFYWNKLSNKSFSFESEQFFYLWFVLAVQGVALITSSIYHCCVLAFQGVALITSSIYHCYVAKTKGIFQES